MKPDTLSFYEQAVQLAVEHVARELDEALELGALARNAALSPFHFHRVFRGMVGETPLELQRRLRMERAAWRLAHSDDAVTRIAFDAGYETHEAFSRAFRNCYSASPSAFRERRYPRTELSASNGVHFNHDRQVVRITFPNAGDMNMQIEIKTLPNLRLGTVRHIGPYNQITEAFERLGQLAGPRGLAQPGTKMLALYYDDPETTPQNELRSDAALVVDANAELPAELTEQHLAAGRYAMGLHVGPYEQLGDTWARLMGQWLPASEHRLGTGVSFELYRNTPQDTPQHALETELYIPLA